MTPKISSISRLTSHFLFRMFTLAAILVANPLISQAQRTMRGQWYADASATCTLSPKAGSHPGVGIEAGRYTMTARWSAFIKGIVPAGGEFGSLTAGGAWLYRVAATPNRALSLYCGGNAFLGVDFDEVNSAVKEVISDNSTDSSATWTQGESGTTSHSAFTYGIEPAAELELFFTRKTALVAGFTVPIRLLTRQETHSLRATAGIRINF